MQVPAELHPFVFRPSPDGYQSSLVIVLPGNGSDARQALASFEAVLGNLPQTSVLAVTGPYPLAPILGTDSSGSISIDAATWMPVIDVESKEPLPPAVFRRTLRDGAFERLKSSGSRFTGVYIVDLSTLALLTLDVWWGHRYDVMDIGMLCELARSHTCCTFSPGKSIDLRRVVALENRVRPLLRQLLQNILRQVHTCIDAAAAR